MTIIEDDIQNIVNSNIPWDQIQGKSFLISGAAGFLATYMAHTIMYLNKTRSTNSTLFALVRNKKEAEQKFSEYLDDPHFKILDFDLNEDFDILEHIDYVIHAASNASPRFYGIDPVGTLLPNVIGTKNILNFSRKHRLRSFLFFSSGEIYGDMGNEKIFEENIGKVDPLDLRSCYAESKRMGENMCVSWNKQYDIPTKIARIFHTYGPGMKLNDGRVFADFVSDVVHARNIMMKSDGNTKRPFCYVSDTIRALFLILLKGENTHAYNISNPSCLVSINELAKIISNLFPSKKLCVVRDKRNNQNKYLKSHINIQDPDISKIMNLGYDPKIMIEEGFRRTINSYD